MNVFEFLVIVGWLSALTGLVIGGAVLLFIGIARRRGWSRAPWLAGAALCLLLFTGVPIAIMMMPPTFSASVGPVHVVCPTPAPPPGAAPSAASPAVVCP